MRRRLFLALAALAACKPSGGASSTPATPAANATEMDITLRPVRSGGPQVIAVAVREEIRGTLPQTALPFSLRVPIVYTSRGGIADRVDSLAVHDASGPVPLRIENDPANASGYTYYRHFHAERPVQMPMTVTYRMRPVPRPTGGPQFEFYAHDGGISSHGSQLYVLPESLGVAKLRVRWDLSELEPGSTAAASLGEGDLELTARPDTLIRSYYMAGPMGVYEPPTPGTGFKLWWLGRPAYDPRKEAKWLYQAYENMRMFFRDPDSSPFRMFTRAVGQGGGTAGGRTFMAAVAAGDMDSTKQAPRNNHAHEMSHYFVGGLKPDSGGEDTGAGGTPWYGEGMNTHYTRLLLLRAGLIPVSAYVNEINNNARNYYTNPYRNMSADSIRKIGYSAGFGSAGAQNLAYTRGSMFWADIDYQLRQKTGGRVKLDDVLVPLLVERRKGKPFTVSVLFDALAVHLGRSVYDHFDAVITRGETLVPASGAFGPCMVRKDTTYTEAGGSNRPVAGYVWTRVASVSEDECRKW